MMAVAHRRFPRPEEIRSNNQPSDDIDNTKSSKKWRTSPLRFVRVCTFLVCLVLGILYAMSLDNNYQSLHTNVNNSKSKKLPAANDVIASKSTTATTSTTTLLQSQEVARQKYGNCSISFVPPPPRRQETEWRKPLWFPAYPASGSASPSKQGDLTKALVNSVTGLSAGAKNYHMSMKNRLRRCKGMSETVACTQGHPHVPIGPETQTENFQSPVVFTIRNIITAFPASYTDKAIAYHGATGQVPEDDWRKVRDQYFYKSLPVWKEMVVWWRTAKYYEIAMYIPFEQLMNIETGPAIVQRLANTFRAAGFEVAPAEDIPCIWYRSVKGEWARQKELMTYEPGYTKEQRDWVLQELETFLKEVQGEDAELVEILKGYYNEVRDHTKLDKPSLNQTATP